MEDRTRRIRIAVVLELVILSIQGWTGDTVNLFAKYPAFVSIGNLQQYISAITGVGGIAPVLIWHEAEALLLVAVAIAVFAIALKTRERQLVILSLLGLASIISAIVGGLMFVLSGFADNAGSAQMGGSFISAYAFFFILLYFAKPSQRSSPTAR